MVTDSFGVLYSLRCCQIGHNANVFDFLTKAMTDKAFGYLGDSYQFSDAYIYTLWWSKTRVLGIVQVKDYWSKFGIWWQE